MESNPFEVMNMMKQEEASVEEVTQDMQHIGLQEDEIKLTENTDHTIKEDLRKEDIQKMMYENETIWNMEEIGEWKDEYTIHVTKEEKPPIYVDEVEQEANMLTRSCRKAQGFL